MNDGGFLATQLIVFSAATVVFVIRLYLDVASLRSKLFLPKLTSLLFATTAWIFYLVVQVLATWRVVIIIQDTAHKTIWSEIDGLNLDHQVWNIKLVQAETWLNMSALWGVKGSFCALYYGLTTTLSSIVRNSLIGTTIYVAISWLVLVLTYALWCRPYSLHWAVFNIRELCQETLSTEILSVTTALHLSTDVAVLTIPLIILRTYRPHGRELWALVSLVAMGCLSIGVGIARAVLSYEHMSTRIITRHGNYIKEILGKAEVASGIVAVSLPAFRRMLLARNPDQSSQPQVNTIGSPPDRRNPLASETEQEVVFLTEAKET